MYTLRVLENKITTIAEKLKIFCFYLQRFHVYTHHTHT